ncbi:hypothetical protein F5Y01DRAFT_315102 [Xylaria sp. FL0043]|nr:hypothetical protein F5Y01DRAFT_315102 [Xylaria sp. FL0043]
MAADTAVFHGLDPRRLSAEDFETASIRSAAPSYVSEAPSYHTLPPNETVPAYTPAATTGQSARTSNSTRQFSSMLPPPSESRSSFARGTGLPPIPRRAELSSTPSLSQFSIAPWSSIGGNNPQARHYQSVANRRVAASAAAAAASSGGPSSSSTSSVEGALRAALSRINASANAAANLISEEDAGLVRPLEDPYLVGEEAAARARSERLAPQMRNAEERERNWNAFRASIENGNNRRGRFTRRFGR